PLFRQRSVIGQIEGPDLTIATDPGMTVDRVQGPVVRRDGDAVGPVDFLLSQHPRNLARAVDAIDAFHVHLQIAAVRAVARVGEPDPAFGIDAAVIGAVVALPVVLLGQDGDFARLHVGANHATATDALLAALAADQPALGVEGIAVGPAA